MTPDRHSSLTLPYIDLNRTFAEDLLNAGMIKDTIFYLALEVKKAARKIHT
jgi:hypothetical protein